jgi:tetratricopeptide (TPR) repeat protein
MPAEQPEEQTVEVYAYRPPSMAPDALPAEPLPAEGGLATGSMTALPSERATPVGAQPVASELAPAGATPPPVAYAAPPPATPTLPPAADGLARQAEQQRQAGDFVGAAATLERALRIQPQEAYLWNRLARVRMEQGSYAQAGNLAKRSNALAKDKPQLKQDNWDIIAVSRRAAGDAAGAMEAEQKARGG